MLADIICAKCNGNGYIADYTKCEVWFPKLCDGILCDMCKGTGILGKIDIEEVDMITISQKEYNELLEYKSMYKDLCT